MGSKPLVWLRGEIKSPPSSRPMPSIGPRCHELRVSDAGRSWRIVYRLDRDAVVIADVFAKTTRQTPDRVIDDCHRRLKLYDEST
jgi:phage-related protein